MKIHSLVAAVTIGLFTLAGLAPAAQGAEVKVLHTEAFTSAIGELGAQFERATGHKLVIKSGRAGVLKDEIAAGESFDVAILTTPMIADLVKTGKIAGGTRTDISRAGVGGGVRAGAPKPDIGSADAFKRALLNPKSVALNGGTRGMKIPGTQY